MCRRSQRSEERFRSPRAAVTYVYKLSDMDARSELCSSDGAVCTIDPLCVYVCPYEHVVRVQPHMYSLGTLHIFSDIGSSTDLVLHLVS